jgi:hypothetical protein
MLFSFCDKHKKSYKNLFAVASIVARSSRRFRREGEAAACRRETADFRKTRKPPL